MSRRRLGWAALALAAAAAAAAAALPALLAGGEDASPAGGPAVVASASVDPRAHFAGDRVVATLDLAVDPARADPERIEVQARFRPYTRVEPVALERRLEGGRLHLRYTYVLQCVDRACVARVPGERAFRFPEVLVAVPDQPIGEGGLRVAWPSLAVGSRLEPNAADERAFRASTVAPAPSSWIGAAALAWLLAGLAALCALLAGAAVWRRSRRGAEEAAPPAEARPASELARALEALAAAGGRDERRAALDGLARALEQAGGNGTAAEARRLAWSRAEPTDEEIAGLVARVGGEEEAR